MGPKPKKNTERISISDSDCEIQEEDIKSITIPDSPQSISASVVNIDDDDDNKDQSNILMETTNIANIAEIGHDSCIFEVNFKNEQIFNEYKSIVVESLLKSLETKGLFIVEDSNSIRIFRKISKADKKEKTPESDAVEASLNVSVPDGETMSPLIEEESPKPEEKITCEDENQNDDEENKEEQMTCKDKNQDETEAEQEDEEDIDISSLFMIDTEPAKKVNTVQIPSYKRTIKEILNESSSGKKKKTDDVCERPVVKKSCFNCDGHDHDIRSCPKPHNRARINKAKKMMNIRRDRYHVDIEQRYAHLRPGQISPLLREALGIRSGELPFFFYRMRVLGYPPGWLEDAKVAHSGISLFDSEGRSVRDPDEEEGQIDSDKNKYDVSKIISFPGFNTNPGKSFYDDYKHHNVPPINTEDCKEKFIEMLGDNVVKGYKRKKLIDLPEAETTEKTTLELSEMEIEENEENIAVANVEFTRPPPPPSPPKDSNVPPPPPPPPDSSQSKTNTRSPSPTLEDLEEKKKQLKELLESSSITISDNEDSLIDELLELETNSSENLTSTPNKTSSKNAIQIDNLESEALGSPSPMSSVLGTPLLKFSPFEKLPCGDNFKVGVSDVINFENLPDSTGTYEKMKGVIKKVRTIVTKLNSEDS